MHRALVPQLFYPSNLPPDPRPLEHQTRAILARIHRPVFEHCAAHVDVVHAGHVLVPVREACCGK